MVNIIFISIMLFILALSVNTKENIPEAMVEDVNYIRGLKQLKLIFFIPNEETISQMPEFQNYIKQINENIEIESHYIDPEVRNPLFTQFEIIYSIQKLPYVAVQVGDKVLGGFSELEQSFFSLLADIVRKGAVKDEL